MKKILKYLLWIPFAVAIGSFVLYLRYIIMFKMNSNIVITDEVNNALNGYLIVSFVSLFMGLVIVLFKKIMNLIHNNKNNIINEIEPSNNIDSAFIRAIEDNNNTIIEYEKQESNFMKDVKGENIIRIKLDKKSDNNLVSGKIINTNQNVDILLSSDDMDMINNINIKNQKKCPKCNGILDEDAIICTHCGILIDKSILSIFNKKECNIVKPKKKSSIFNLIINLIVIFLCIFLIFLIGNKIINQKNENYNKMNISFVNENR